MSHLKDEPFDSRDLPHSTSVDYATCGKCPALHLVLKDESGQAFAIAVLSRDMIETMLTTVKEYERTYHGVN